MRDIDDILYFRSDLSPFLVHLTRKKGQETAKSILETILKNEELIAGSSNISDVRFGGNTTRLSKEEDRDYFGAVCFTETPLNETHCLLEIQNRQVNLEPYGLVFLKDNLRSKGVSPVCYLNNESADKEPVAKALFSLIKTHPEAAKELLPLFSVFGEKLIAPGATRPKNSNSIDFLWEREWRYPAAKGHLSFTKEDVFVGLCPDEEITRFELKYRGIDFIDPRYNMKWYATQLVKARKKLDMKHSVV